MEEKIIKPNKDFDLSILKEALRKYLEENKIPYKEDDISHDFKGQHELPRSKNNRNDKTVS